ncbi:hypothetical protein EVAR_65273_1 [Eumeta japonica]|uniref:Uncharacterized protein n=1 Tax=Eumeta variegata TaxID=151549 RepID=A0A4C1Z8G4_EUMVA|nr:hypothetical protein EVAR_65273_1 [Eumeta japonica]
MTIPGAVFLGIFGKPLGPPTVMLAAATSDMLLLRQSDYDKQILGVHAVNNFYVREAAHPVIQYYDQSSGVDLRTQYVLVETVELDDDISPFDFRVLALSSIGRFDVEEENETS